MKIANKFDRKSQQLKARVQFVRGTIRKGKGVKLSDADVDTMTDLAISDEVDLGTLEIVERSEDADPAEVDPPKNDGKPGKAA